MITVGNIVVCVLAICTLCLAGYIAIVLSDEHQRKKHCNHLCSICKYRYMCDWRDMESITDDKK